jgi:hypothetical protein
MKTGMRTWALAAAVIAVLLLITWALAFGPRFPTAIIQVVDAAGKPIAGAVVKPEGLRTKAGPYISGWYNWRADGKDVPKNDPVTTDRKGCARIPYPKFVFERIETGTLCLSVSHPDFVSERPECIVATTPPARAPWRLWADFLSERIQHKVIIAYPDPVVLKQGATLIISTRPDSPGPKDTPLFAQVSGDWDETPDFWSRPGPGVIATRRLATGRRMVRAIRFDANGSAWFSDAFTIMASAGQSNEVEVDFKKGITVRGQLDAAVPRPVKNGRVIAHVWPHGCAPSDYPPHWHAWAAIHEDGSFEVGSLPAGDLEIVAICNGFISTNGPGKSKMRYPQKHELGSNDLAIMIGMEATARLEVRVTDDKGKPLKGARVSTWPNVRNGEWFATVFASDCYNTADKFQPKPGAKPREWFSSVPDFEGTSDESGVAVLPNLPADVSQFAVECSNYALPAIEDSSGRKDRHASVTLTAGVTNHANVQLEREDAAPITHY